MGKTDADFLKGYPGIGGQFAGLEDFQKRQPNFAWAADKKRLDPATRRDFPKQEEAADDEEADGVNF